MPEEDASSVADDARRERLVELANAQPRVVVVLEGRQRARGVEDLRKQTQQAADHNPARRPCRGDHARVDSPYLAGVRTEEGLVERTAEVTYYPALEVGRVVMPRGASCHVPSYRANRERNIKAAKHVRRLERMGPESAFEKNPGTALLKSHVSAHELACESHHARMTTDQTMATVIPCEVVGSEAARESADRVLGLDDSARCAAADKGVSRGEARGTCPNHNRGSFRTSGHPYIAQMRIAMSR